MKYRSVTVLLFILKILNILYISHNNLKNVTEKVPVYIN